MLVRSSSARVGLALCYHRIAECGGDPAHEVSAAVSIREFERHLRHLRRRYQVVPASGLTTATTARRRGRRLPVAITFDDDLASHLAHAAPALQRARLPATFFLSGAGLRGPFSFWWQLLQRAWDGGLVDADVLTGWGVPAGEVSVRRLAQTIQAMRPVQRSAAAASLREVLGEEPTDDTLGADAVEALARAGFEIGFHTLEHHELTALNADELDAAMRTGRAELEEVVGCTSMISYPHGRADARVAAAASAAGFRFGFVADGRAVTGERDPHLLGRRYPARGPSGQFELDVARTLYRASPWLWHRRR
jgi:peptidoglycan/xylan/chitin deacetylase (PgdA/CDA1 family)